jgi:hypothetical protein
MQFYNFIQSLQELYEKYSEKTYLRITVLYYQNKCRPYQHNHSSFLIISSFTLTLQL